MANDKRFRTLAALRGASSSRVLNLTGISLSQANNAGHGAAPFFASAVLNASIILKHRLRADEGAYFSDHRTLVTKVVVPFQKDDLNVGGRSLFVFEHGYEKMLHEIGNYQDEGEFKRDLDILHLLDRVPSLDPFLLREHLAQNGFAPDPCYFALSTADQSRIFDFAAEEVRRLTNLAVGKSQASASNKMTSALLANEINEVLEPLRMTLDLNASEFSEGIFAWRGFLYYKWSLDDLWPSLVATLRAFDSIRVKGGMDPEAAKRITAIKRAIKVAVVENRQVIQNTIGVYDTAFNRLIEHQDPAAFRSFLLSAPSLFVDIGERIGVLSHITTFWRYRFPRSAVQAADEEELTILFSDFAQSLGLGKDITQTAA